MTYEARLRVSAAVFVVALVGFAVPMLPSPAAAQNPDLVRRMSGQWNPLMSVTEGGGRHYVSKADATDVKQPEQNSIAFSLNPGTAGDTGVSNLSDAFPGPWEERLLVTIPSEYQKPGAYGPGPEGVYLVFRGISDRRVADIGISDTEFAEGWSPVFSPDGKQVAYRAKLKGKEFIVVNDKPGPQFDQVNIPVFSPNGKTVAYSARIGKRGETRWLVIVGEQKGPELEWVGLPVFRPDSAAVAYGAREHGKAFMMFDGQRGPEFDQVSIPVFSHDGKTIAYVARQKQEHGKWKDFVVVGGQKGPEFEQVGELVFSPVGNKVAYMARRNGKSFMMVGDDPGPEFGLVYAPTFNADGSKVAYVAMQETTFGFHWFVVNGNQKGPEYSSVGPPVFSPDGSKLAYAAYAGAKGLWLSKPDQNLLVSGEKIEEVNPAPEVIQSAHIRGVSRVERSLVFSPDGQKIACRGYLLPDSKFLRSKVQFHEAADRIVVGGQTSDHFDMVGIPVFSADGKQVAFGAQKGRELWWKVMPVR